MYVRSGSPLGHVSSSSDLRRCFLAFMHGWRYCRSTPWGFNSLPEFTNSPIEAISNTCGPERASERQERLLGRAGSSPAFSAVMAQLASVLKLSAVGIPACAG
jgi:hypothetical protein